MQRQKLIGFAVADYQGELIKLEISVLRFTDFAFPNMNIDDVLSRELIAQLIEHRLVFY